MTDPTARARTHIKAIVEVLRDAQTPGDPAHTHLFMSGLLTGLATGLRIVDGESAEAALERVDTQMAAAVGRAYLSGGLPIPTAKEATDG